MTIEEFTNIRKHDLLDLIINGIICVAAIILSLFFQIKFLTLLRLELSNANLFYLFISFLVTLSIMGFGFYGLFVLIKPLKVAYWKNEMTRDENIDIVEKLCADLNAKNFQTKDNIIQFTYQKNFWSYNQKLYFYIEKNIVAVCVDTIDSNPKRGFLDFGAASRTQKKVLKLLINKASR